MFESKSHYHDSNQQIFQRERIRGSLFYNQRELYHIFINTNLHLWNYFTCLTYFELRNLVVHNPICRGLWNLVFQSWFSSNPCVYFLGFFLTTLNIYKDYFKGCKRLCKCEEKVLFMQIVTGDRICPSSSFSWRSCYVCTP